MKNKSKGIIIGFIAVAMVVVLLVSGVSKNKNNASGFNTSAAIVGQNSPNSSLALFSTSPLSKNAYLISTPNYDANTNAALSGFKVVKNNLSDGTMQITLNAIESGYTTQTYNVKPGEKLYFIEAMFGDDGNNHDGTLGDEKAVLVDANGYIIG
jgi:hypothetical protein